LPGRLDDPLALPEQGQQRLGVLGFDQGPLLLGQVLELLVALPLLLQELQKLRADG